MSKALSLKQAYLRPATVVQDSESVISELES